MHHDIHFTLLEARELLFIIIPKLEKIIQLKKLLESKGYDIYNHMYFGGRGPNGTGAFPVEMEQLVDIVKEILTKGVQIKDMETGLIDFPHIRSNGEEVYLCYLLGETGINFWHSIEGGFKGRRNIDEL